MKYLLTALIIVTVSVWTYNVAQIMAISPLTLGNLPQYNNKNTPLTLGTMPNSHRINPQGPTYNPQKTEEYIQ